jgi:uncharacterized Zn-finger protein
MSRSSISPPDPGNAPANAENRYEVTVDDLPLSCPMPGMSLWNSHPRVFLPIEADGESKCPYCGAIFVLKR